MMLSLHISKQFGQDIYYAHHNLFITLLMESKAKTVFAKQSYFIQEKCLDYMEK